MVTVLVLLCFDVTIIPPIPPPLLFAVEVIFSLLKSKSLFFFQNAKRERERERKLL